MPIFDTFTKRKRRAERGGADPPLQHEDVPQALRVQVMYIWRETIGGWFATDPWMDTPPSNARWQMIRDIVARERGVFSLSRRADDNPLEQCAALLLEGPADDALEIIEATFRYVDVVMRRQSDDWRRQREGLAQSPEDAVEELNARFKEHGVGYRYQNGMLIRIDSELLYSEATLPALDLLQANGFEGALEEFMSAHAHNKRGEFKDANVDALNALESTLKTICDKRRWKYSGTATASDLVKVVMRNGLIPPELQTQFENLIKAMETGLPPIRHNYGGHGQGAAVKTVEQHLAEYSLHLMAANIVLLIEAHEVTK